MISTDLNGLITGEPWKHLFSARNELNENDQILFAMLDKLTNERDIEAVGFKKANQCNSFKFADTQLCDKFNYHGGATSFDCFVKAEKTSAEETKRFFPHEWFLQ